MRIGIDIRSTLKKRTGIGQYTLNLLNHLAKADKDNNYILYSKKKIFDRKRRLPIAPGNNFKHCIDYFSRGPQRLLKEVDIFHSSSYDLEKPARAKLVLTVHDVIIKAYPAGHTQETIAICDRQLKEILPRAECIITDSICTKNDLLKWYGIDSNIVKVVYPGVNKWFYPDNCQDEKYLLFVSTIEPRKNLSGVIKAFEKIKKQYKIEHKLVVIGMKGWMYEKVFADIASSEFKDEIIIKDYIANEELRSWYNRASVFVFPSFYEGFGFPIVEAFACGTPVVTSKTSSCGEIAQDAAILVNPNEPESIAKAVMDVISDSKLRAELIEKGLNRAKMFSWDKTARETLSIFQSIYKQEG